MIDIQFHHPVDMYHKDHQVKEFLLNVEYDLVEQYQDFLELIFVDNFDKVSLKKND
jgi:hypothetical protein